MKKQNLFKNIWKRILFSWKKESWKGNFVNLLWGAGPVCFISLALGYYASTYRVVSLGDYIYFGIYTLGLGIFGILTRLFLNSTKGFESAEGKGVYNKVVREMLTALNTTLHYKRRSLTETEIDKEDCFFILENADASSSDLALAMNLLDKGGELAEAIREIEIFRCYGMNHQIAKTNFNVQEKLEEVIESHQLTKNQAKALRNRFQGQSPSKKAGLERNSGFLTRILLAQRTQNLKLIESADIHELFYLIFELLCGRNIDVFSLNLKEFKTFSKTFKEIEVLMESLSFLQRAMNYEIQELKGQMVHYKKQNLEPSVKEFLDFLNHYLFNEGKNNSLSLSFKLPEIREVWEKFKWIDHPLAERMSSIYAIFDDISKMAPKLEKLNETYKKKQGIFWNNSRLAYDLDHLNIDKRNDPIYLNEEKKLGLARDLHKLIQRRWDELSISPDHPYSQSPLMGRVLRSLAGDMILALGRYINLDDYYIRFAIENSYSANLGSINLHLTTKTILMWTESLVEEVENATPKVLFKYVDWYVHFKRDTLNRNEVEFFSENFEVPTQSIQNREVENNSVVLN